MTDMKNFSQSGKTSGSLESPKTLRKQLSSILVAIAVGSSPIVNAQQSAPIKVDSIVAVVNDEAIPATELQMRIGVTERQIKRQNQPVPPREALGKQVLERLITDRALIQHAREKGIRAEDAVVDQALMRIAAENKLALAALKDRVERDGMSFERFREDIRDEITVSRLREREVDARITISESEVDRLLAEQSGSADTTEYNVAQILLRVPENATPEQVERQRLRAEELIKQVERGTEFARLSAAFSEAPEALTGGGLGWRTAERLPQIFLDAVRPLRVNQVAPLVRSANGFHILRLIDKRSAGMVGTGGPVAQTRASHILIRVDGPATEAAVRARLAEIKAKAIAGTDTFANLAKSNSVDGSASNGGDLGWVLPGDTVPEFEKAMLATPVNGISDPVRSQFGMHIIQVVDRKTAPMPEDRVRQQAKQVIRERKSEQQYQEWIQLIRDRAYVELRTDEG
jgi:peptidyl-prolyl cis-trans isomerase SurA